LKELYIATSHNKKSIKRFQVENQVGPDLNNLAERPKEGPWEESDLILTSADKSIVPRLVRAMKHAVTLCGGKVEPF
jgi:hypothetical protein